MTELPSAVTEQYFKQIVYDEAQSHLFLLNPSNKSFECDIYGNSTTKFNKSITGQAKFPERIKRSLIKAVLLNSDRRLYHPQNRCFEGYSQFPRPLSQPFLNKYSERTELLDSLIKNKILTRPDNTHLLKLRTNQGLSFISSSIAFENKSNKETLIKLIDTTCKEYDNEEEMSQKHKHKYSQANIKALKKLKQTLLLNSKDTVYGRKLPEPTALAKRQNQAIVQLYRNLPNEKIKMKNRHLKNSFSLPSLLHVESLFDNAKKNNKKDDDKSIELLFTIPKDKDNRQKTAIIRGERSYRIKCSEEKRLLSGYKTPVIKEEGIIQKGFPQLPTRGDHYKRELEIIALVNPFVIQEELRRNASDKYIFDKKRKIKMTKIK